MARAVFLKIQEFDEHDPESAGVFFSICGRPSKYCQDSILLEWTPTVMPMCFSVSHLVSDAWKALPRKHRVLLLAYWGRCLSVQRKPQILNATVLQPQTKERRNISINHPTSSFQHCLIRPSQYRTPYLLTGSSNGPHIHVPVFGLYYRILWVPSQRQGSASRAAVAMSFLHFILYSVPQPPTLGLQIAPSRSYLHTLGPKVGIIYVLGALGYTLFPNHQGKRKQQTQQVQTFSMRTE